jgi:hypothetical protein
MDEHIIEVEAESLEEVTKKIKAQTPEGFQLISQKIVSDGRSRTVKAMAETTEAAFAKAQNEIPSCASVIQKRVNIAHERFAMRIKAFDEQNARAQAVGKIGTTSIINTLKLVTLGKKGLFGVGKTPNEYEAEILQQAVVEIDFKIKAKISASIGKPQPCSRCGEILQPHVSGQMAAFFQVPFWPCPKCDLLATTIVVSEHGVAAERSPMLMTVRKSPSGVYELLRGFGSISSPDPAAQRFQVPNGEKALHLINMMFTAVSKLSNTVDDPFLLKMYLQKML